MLNFLQPCVLLRIKSCENKSFHYFYKDVWNEYAMKESKQFPLFKDGPYQFYASLLLWLIFLHVILEPLMQLKAKPFNFRPLLLIFNSFEFTINLVGFLILSCYITNFGLNLWTCEFKVNNANREVVYNL